MCWGGLGGRMMGLGGLVGFSGLICLVGFKELEGLGG